MELLNRERPHAPNSASKRYAGARWFLHGHGHTIGPLAEQEIFVGFKKGEYLPSDRVFSAQDGHWIELQSHAIFSHGKPQPLARRAADFERLPSPRTLPAKKEPAPVEPVVAAIELPVVEGANPETPILLHSVLEEPAREELKAEPAQELTPEPMLELARESVRAEKVEEATEDDLIQAALELERALDGFNFDPALLETATDNTPSVSPRLDFQPVVIPEPVFVAPNFPAPTLDGPKIIQFHLKLPERPLRFAVFWLLFLGTICGAVSLLPKNSIWSSGEEKTRGLNDFRLSDPSSPTTSLQEADDPIPPLKAPARPQRD